ncbi:hypothetical protein, partial [Frankia sp. Cr1]|uniref:hypothetical protein n=1 Tax=Frankia sp. Cr1 TaxID=3073931 RepID=UPI002AD56F72
MTAEDRRALNQAVFTHFWVIRNQVDGADLTEPFARLLIPEQPAAVTDPETSADDHEAAFGNPMTALANSTHWQASERSKGRSPEEAANLRQLSDEGSNMPTL